MSGGGLSIFQGGLSIFQPVPVRGATKVVAAADSLAASKAQADYVCDGTADEVEIQAAIDALPTGGGKVVLSAGTFVLATMLSIDKSNVILEGQGIATILDADGACVGLGLGSGAAHIYCVHIRDLKIANGDAYNIQINKLNQSTIERVYLSGRDGVTDELAHVVHSAQLTYDNCIFLGFENYAIYHTVGNNNTVVNCYFNEYNAPLDGTCVYVADGVEFNILNSIFEYGYTFIEFANAASNCKVDNCYTEDGNNIDIIVNAGCVKVSNCYMNGTSTATNGVKIGLNVVGVIVENNYFVNYTGLAIDFEGYGNTKVSFRGNKGTSLGVLQDEDIARIHATLGFWKVDILWPLQVGAGEQAHDISGSGDNGVILNSPTWGTVPATGWGRLTLNGTSQYIRHPAGGRTDDIVANGDRTWIAVVSPDFLESEDENRVVFFWFYDNDNRVYLQKLNNAGGNVFIFRQIGQATSQQATKLLGFAQNDILIFMCTYNDTTKVGRLYCNGQLQASFSGGDSPAANAGAYAVGRHVESADYHWKGDVLLAGKLPLCLSEADVARFSRTLATLVGIAPVAVPDKRQFSDLFLDVLATSANHVRNNEDLSAAIPITFTIDAQPDCPRTITWALTHGNITEFDLEIKGVTAKGDIVTETFDEDGGWSGETNRAFAIITHVKLMSRTGTGAGDTCDVGIGSKLGLANIIYGTEDVYKCTKNAADYSGAGNITVDATYDTVDVSTGGAIGGGDDFRLLYRSDLNIVA